MRKALRAARPRATVVVLVDEFERCFAAPGSFPVSAFFDNLRSMLGGDNQGPYARSVIATRRTLAEYFATHQVTSVLPNYLEPLSLELLSAEDAEDVLAPDGPHRLKPAQRDQAAAWAGGHPCLLQCGGEACYRAAAGGQGRDFAEQEFRQLSRQLCLGVEQAIP